jgi:hypothetical protein
LHTFYASAYESEIRRMQENYTEDEREKQKADKQAKERAK